MKVSILLVPQAIVEAQSGELYVIKWTILNGHGALTAYTGLW